MAAAGIALGLFTLVAIHAAGVRGSLSLPYSSFVRQVEHRNVATVTTRGFAISGELRHGIRVSGQNGGRMTTAFTTQRPAFAGDAVITTLERQGAVVRANATGGSTVVTVLLSLLWPLLLIGMFIMIFRRSRGAGAGMMNVSRSTARRYDGGAARTTFADVAGIDEVTEQLEE